MEISRTSITDNLEDTLTEVFERTHRCPWYKRKPKVLFFSYYRNNSGLGEVTTVKCDNCGKEFDVTNYKLW